MRTCTNSLPWGLGENYSFWGQRIRKINFVITIKEKANSLLWEIKEKNKSPTHRKNRKAIKKEPVFHFREEHRKGIFRRTYDF